MRKIILKIITVSVTAIISLGILTSCKNRKEESAPENISSAVNSETSFETSSEISSANGENTTDTNDISDIVSNENESSGETSEPEELPPLWSGKKISELFDGSFEDYVKYTDEIFEGKIPAPGRQFGSIIYAADDKTNVSVPIYEYVNVLDPDFVLKYGREETDEYGNKSKVIDFEYGKNIQESCSAAADGSYIFVRYYGNDDSYSCSFDGEYYEEDMWQEDNIPEANDKYNIHKTWSENKEFVSHNEMHITKKNNLLLNLEYDENGKIIEKTTYTYPDDEHMTSETVDGNNKTTAKTETKKIGSRWFNTYRLQYTEWGLEEKKVEFSDSEPVCMLHYCLYRNGNLHTEIYFDGKGNKDENVLSVKALMNGKYVVRKRGDSSVTIYFQMPYLYEFEADAPY